jgi:hypothetical protein
MLDDFGNFHRTGGKVPDEQRSKSYKEDGRRADESKGLSGGIKD